MRKQLLFISATLFCSAFIYGANNVDAQGLTINNGSTLTINGGILDVNCLDILVKSGGTLDLQTGTLKNKDVLIDEAGGFTNTSGKILTCGGNSFYVIPNQNGSMTIITLPKN